MKTIFSKIFLGYIIVISIFTITILYFSYQVIREGIQNSLIQSLLRMNNAIDGKVSNYLEVKDYVKLDIYIKSLSKKIKYRITIIDIQGNVIADTKGNPKLMDNHGNRPEIIKALENRTGSSVRHSYTAKKDMLYVAVAVKSGDNTIGVSRLSANMDDVDSTIGSLRNKIFNIVISLLLISVIISYIFSRSITKPIRILTNLSHSVAQGNFNTKADLEVKGELKILADSFNNMVNRIKNLFDETNLKKEELNNIIASIQEGLVVIDSQGKIVLANDAFKKMINQYSLMNRFYWEVILNDEINDYIKMIQIKPENVSQEILIKENYYICSANFLNSKKDIIMIFYNITNLKKLENIKKDFVTNVSHELRTPLTVIKGYIETLEDIGNKKSQKYIGIIGNHTNRLIAIVQDLLSISRLEEKFLPLDYSKVKLTSLFSNLSSTFEKKLKEKNLKFNYHIGTEITSFKADEFKMEQMLINLLDNAIKYTESGNIHLSANKENTNIKFEITDTGIGIPDADKERIFERFYTVDKSRSRKLAGTGLGLSIVKHIVMLHKGRIWVENAESGGSKFIILIPNYYK